MEKERATINKMYRTQHEPKQACNHMPIKLAAKCNKLTIRKGRATC